MSANTLAVEAVANTGAIPQPPSKNDALAALTKYIPTESITLYISTVSAQDTIQGYLPWLTPQLSYKLFIGITPILMLLLFLRQLAVANQPWKLGPTQWPIWRMIASTIAFAVWALAVPGNPIVDSSSATGGVAAGFAAVLVSSFLNLLAPFFEKAA